MSCTGAYFVIITFQTSYCDDFNHQMFCYFELYKELLSSQCTSYVHWTFWFLPPVVLPPGAYLHPSPQTPHQHGTSNHMEKVGCTQDKLSLTFSLEMLFVILFSQKLLETLILSQCQVRFTSGFASLDISPTTMEKVGEHIRSTQDKLSVTFSQERVCFCNFQLHKMFAKEYDEKSFSYTFVRIKKSQADI